MSEPQERVADVDPSLLNSGEVSDGPGAAPWFGSEQSAPPVDPVFDSGNPLVHEYESPAEYPLIVWEEATPDQRKKIFDDLSAFITMANSLSQDTSLSMTERLAQEKLLEHRLAPLRASVVGDFSDVVDAYVDGPINEDDSPATPEQRTRTHDLIDSYLAAPDISIVGFSEHDDQAEQPDDSEADAPSRLDTARSAAKVLRSGGLKGAAVIAASDGIQRHRAGASERAHRWNNASLLKKVGLVACSAAGAYLIYRVARPFAGDVIEAFGSGSGDHEALWHNATEANASKTQPNVYVSAGEEHHYHYADHQLGEWVSRNSEKGTVEGQVRDYSSELGYGKLTPGQVHNLTGKALENMGLSWHDASRLGNNFVPKFPEKTEMDQWLQSVGAQQTGPSHDLQDDVHYTYTTTCNPGAKISSADGNLAGHSSGDVGPRSCALPDTQTNVKDGNAGSGGGQKTDTGAANNHPFIKEVTPNKGVLDSTVAALELSVLAASGLLTYAALSSRRSGAKRGPEDGGIQSEPVSPPLPEELHVRDEERYHNTPDADGDDSAEEPEKKDSAAAEADDHANDKTAEQVPIMTEAAIKWAATDFLRQFKKNEYAGLFELRSRNAFFHDKIVSEIMRSDPDAALKYRQYVVDNSDED
ncbi:MAG TPA: hypothetical protein VMR45_02610 [Patescibacteria group bacterium]|nr:hypothetical protein [Patescibacteria group bacterium]